MGDRRDLGGMIDKGPLEGGQEMLGRNFGERRRLERRLPRLQQRVGLGCEIAAICWVSDITIPVFALEPLGLQS